MKKTFLFVLIVIGSFLKAQETKRVLFLGNSYTYFNNLPSLIDNLAQTQGNDLIYDSNTPGGYTFQGHSTNAASLNKIKAQNWDYVVLQEQSQIPSFPPAQVASDCYPYAAILNDSILSNNPCTEPLFYMTWGRKNGDAGNCGFYPPLCTYSGMQQRLTESYMELALDNNASVAPVGVAWQAVRNLYPLIELYNPDESHPSLAGSYLAACVFYSSIFRATTVGNSYWAGLDSLTAYRLQVIGSSTVLDSLSFWSIGANDLSLNLPNDTSFCGDSLLVFAHNVQGSLTWSTGEIINPITLENSALVYASVENNRGCLLTDSVSINLSVGYHFTESIQACDSIEIEGFWYFEDTILTKSYVIANGCDSVYSREVNFSLTSIVYSINGINSLVDSSYLFIDNAGWDSIYVFFVSGDTFINIDTISFLCDISGYALAWNTCGVDSVRFNQVFCEAIQELNESWSIGPNPSKGLVTVSNDENQGFSLRLLNILGQDLYKGVYHESPAETLDIKSFENGTYFILIYDENNEALGKKMIQKL